MFEQDAKNLYDRMANDKMNWKVKMLYDSKLDKKPRRWKKAEEATILNVEDYFADLIEKAKKGRIKNFSLFTDTHGSKSPHTICIGHGIQYPVSKLVKYLKELAKEGVKTMVMDTSCHSGDTLDVFKGIDNLCSMTSTTNQEYAYISQLVPQFFPGKNRYGRLKRKGRYNNPSVTGPNSTTDFDRSGSISVTEAFTHSNFVLDRADNIALPGISSCNDSNRKLLSMIHPFMRQKDLFTHFAHHSGEVEKTPTGVRPESAFSRLFCATKFIAKNFDTNINQKVRNLEAITRNLQGGGWSKRKQIYNDIRKVLAKYRRYVTPYGRSLQNALVSFTDTSTQLINIVKKGRKLSEIANGLAKKAARGESLNQLKQFASDNGYSIKRMRSMRGMTRREACSKYIMIFKKYIDKLNKQAKSIVKKFAKDFKVLAYIDCRLKIETNKLKGKKDPCDEFILFKGQK